MSTPHQIARLSRVGFSLGASLVLLTSFMGCTTPGAVAPSTLPVGDQYVELGPREEVSSCGYTALVVPIKNPAPLSEIIEGMVKARGGDALIEVTSHSSQAFYVVGIRNCLAVQGKVVRVGK